MVRVAVIGCGYWGPNLIRNVNACPDTTLSVICDLDESRLARVASQYPAAQTTTRVEDIWNRAEIDAEQIAFPPLEPGDTVVCEFSFSADFFPQQYTITPGCCSIENKRQGTAVYYDWVEACDSFRVAMPRNKAVHSLFYRPIPIVVLVEKHA